MKLINNTIALAVLSATSFSGMASTLDFYGKANVSFQNSDDGDGSFTEVKSNASRLGVKGSNKLNETFELFYQAEFQIDIDGSSDKGDSITDRNQFVGLKGNFGDVRVGNIDTVLKSSQGKVDLFNDLEADIKVLWKGENRMSNSVIYRSPKFNNFQVSASYIAEGDADNDSAASIAMTYGDAKLKKSQIFASVSHDDDVKGYDVTRAVVRAKVIGVKLGAVYHTQTNNETDIDTDGFLVSAEYGIGQIALKAQVQTADTDNGDDKSVASIGADYKFDKSTKAYVFYSSFDMDSNPDQDYAAVGVEYKF